MALTIQEERKAAELAREMVKETDILNAYLRRQMRDHQVSSYFNTDAMRKAEDLGLPRHCGPLVAAIDAYVEKLTA